MIKNLFMALLAFFALCVQAVHADPLAEAKLLFERYEALETRFDPGAADLYADNAVIRNKRFYPDGQVRELTIPAPQYKQLIRDAMPLAQARNDRNTYTKTTYKLEGMGVRIQATRFSVMKQYDSPISLLVAPDASGRWLIREELTESRPF
ncbi:MAG: hypothetical protein AB1593_09960 [Pseudomonadota bacterium]